MERILYRIREEKAMLSENLTAIDQIDMEIILRLFHDQQNRDFQWQASAYPAEPLIIVREKEGNC